MKRMSSGVCPFNTFEYYCWAYALIVMSSIWYRMPLWVSVQIATASDTNKSNRFSTPFLYYHFKISTRNGIYMVQTIQSFISALHIGKIYLNNSRSSGSGSWLLVNIRGEWNWVNLFLIDSDSLEVVKARLRSHSFSNLCNWSKVP